MVSGNLTLRDITKNISFPARVTIGASSLTAKADFNIDRTMWGMNYKGPNNPQDWFISKEVNLKLDLSASKK
jgi:polyisoprenoid-binding protein YceI